MKKIILWPFLIWFSAIFIFLGLFSTVGFFAIIVGAFLFFISHHCRLTLDEHFITGYDGVMKKGRVIIERKNLRLVEGKRNLGKCWILDDRTSTQEIIMYRWMFTLEQIKKIESWIASKS